MDRAESVSRPGPKESPGSACPGAYNGATHPGDSVDGSPVLPSPFTTGPTFAAGAGTGSKMKRYLVACTLAAIALSCSSSHDDDPGTGGNGVLCPLWIAPGIMLEVRNAVTGLPAACGASGKAEGEGLIQPLSTGVDCNLAPDYLYLSGIDRVGTFTVTVERPGYRSWVRDGIDVMGGPCGLLTVQLRADLEPL